jgi:hypothetical protein
MPNQELEKENQFAYCVTQKWVTVDFMMYSHAWHGKAPNDTQLVPFLGQNYTEAESDY